MNPPEDYKKSKILLISVCQRAENHPYHEVRLSEDEILAIKYQIEALSEVEE